jgi:hypothetical protein
MTGVLKRNQNTPIPAALKPGIIYAARMVTSRRAAPISTLFCSGFFQAFHQDQAAQPRAGEYHEGNHIIEQREPGNIRKWLQPAP